MKKRKILSVLLASIFTLTLMGCGNTSDNKDTGKTDGQKSEATAKVKDGGTMVFRSATDPTCLNPFFQSNRITFTVNNALFDPLFVVDTNETRNYLADSLKISDDNLTYTVKLKNNLKWHDGQKITADDIVFTVNAIQNEKNAIADRESFVIDGKNIEVKKIDDLTVEFKLPQAFAPFDSSLGSLTPIPKHIFENESDLAKSEKNNTPVGSGPFKFKEWKKGEALTLERFNDYYLGKPHLESLVYRIIPDDNTAKIAFENGEVSATYLSEENYKKMSSDEKFTTHAFDEGMLLYLNYNMKNKDLKNPDVRKAISYALNKDEIIKSSYEDPKNTQVANSVLVPSTKYYTDSVTKYDNNVEKAKELLKKAGCENLKLNFQYISGKSDEKIAQIIQQQLKPVGIDVELQALDANTFYAKFDGQMERDFDLVLNGYVLGVDPNGYANAFTTKGPYNIIEYSNPEVDKLFEDGAVESDTTKRKSIYEKAQKLISDDAPVYPINYSKSFVGVNAKFGGIKEAKTVPIYMFEDLSKLYMVEK
ncbi:peptide/nickel transport system substrate-binding protein [Clostridium collagenovorans DSM 3089]|uniref:Peptide/nickel transport system substrate-binding protein n=1 Tax=Clostridium collagenovorans DSM 3089 TaxID=1121306 RepID=A0A1M5VXV3_9CLOT|nr:ABC transporter substrate-binding protein [Clostridium collagenovorans]SHH80139.1 peptide/nickel transport system substrate-binding protein [Clostridium collagenovorans DSM 3089]